MSFTLAGESIFKEIFLSVIMQISHSSYDAILAHEDKLLRHHEIMKQNKDLLQKGRKQKATEKNYILKKPREIY